MAVSTFRSIYVTKLDLLCSMLSSVIGNFVHVFDSIQNGDTISGPIAAHRELTYEHMAKRWVWIQVSGQINLIISLSSRFVKLK